MIYKKTYQPGKRMIKKISLVLFVLCIISAGTGYCLNIDKVRVAFLSGDYKAAILEGEKVLAVEGHSPDVDELYYLLGLSYLKEGNYLRASDIFEIILREFSNSGFKEKAKIGLGDIDFLKGDLDKAQSIYEELLNSTLDQELKALIYYRLSEVAFKKDDSNKGKEYLAKLKDEFPGNIETKTNRDLAVIADAPSNFYYTVQVGCFSNGTNAHNLTQKLIGQGYSAYIEEASDPASGKMYRVRAGKVSTRQAASLLEARLSAEGYPTKIYP